MNRITTRKMPKDLHLHLPVYNLEVEDFHTYYAGKHGVWVHNINCDKLNFEVARTPPAGPKQGQVFLLQAHCYGLACGHGSSPAH